MKVSNYIYEIAYDLLFSIGLHLEISIDMYDLDDENLIACMILTT